MIREKMIYVATHDVAGKLRGKAFPAADIQKRLRRGVGWTPTNVQITCFDAISESPYGALGDLLLVPDPDSEMKVDFQDGTPAEHLMLGDICELDGSPWECCTRSILKGALRRLNKVAGFGLTAAFEHEFQLKTANRPIGDAYSRAGYRDKAVFAETLMAALRQAGLGPDTFMKEYGVDQYEVTLTPDDGLRAADASSILRELVHCVAARTGDAATFTPIRAADGVGNGVHIHMSFRDLEGNPTTYDPNGPHGMAEKTGAFLAGILKYVDSIVALTAPSVLSYQRLTPHRWSAAFNNLGVRDREATVRICPTTSSDPEAIAKQYNFEFRAADAAASPHLAMAAILHAGIQGIEEGLSAPEATQEDLSLLDPTVLAERGFVRLPLTLNEALERFASNMTVTNWFPGQFPDVYRLHKEGEIAFLEDKDDPAIFSAYEAVY